MDVTLLLHVEAADTESGTAWWAESPDLEGFYAVGDTLGQLRECAWEAIVQEAGTDVRLVERLVPSEFSSPTITKQQFVVAHPLPA